MEWKRKVNWRILMVALCTILIFSTLSFRIYWLQTVKATDIMETAQVQWDRQQVLKPKRGAIYDRNGEILAYNGKAYTVNAKLKPRNDKDEDFVKDPYYTANMLAPILNAPVPELVKNLTKPNKVVELGRYGLKISEEQRNRILNLQYPTLPSGEKLKKNQLPGIYLTETTRRVYPNNAFASHVIGYLDLYDEPKMGIELQLNEELAGKQGHISYQRDRAGYQLPDGEGEYIPAIDGVDVYLTIDRQIQDYVEQALDKVEQQYKPQGMTVIVTDPQTGEVLAMGNRSQFNPNMYYNGIENYNNHAVTTMFEPGSTFKIITLAAAIEEKMFNQNETYQSGAYTIKGQIPIRDHNNGAGWGTISFLEGVQRSSNVLFVKLGYERLKLEGLKKYFKKFGMGQPTGIELPYEKAGNLNNLEKPRSPRDWAATTYGQAATVTAIQQVAAVGAIANGGELLKPHIVKEMRDPHTGAVVNRSQREVVERVVSEATAKQTRDILGKVVSERPGTGTLYQIEGYQVAGKTGTAQKYNPNTGKIMDGRYVGSFIGFAPKDNPKLLVYVVIDDPQTDAWYAMWGQMMLAPMFTTIMERSLQYLQQQPDLSVGKNKQSGKETSKKATQAVQASSPATPKTLPKFEGMSTTAAQMRAKQDNLTVTVAGTGTKIVKQYPQAYDQVLSGEQIILVTDRVQGTKMPDFKGKSLRDVMEFSSLINLEMKSTGTGFVTQQSIPPGTVLQGTELLQVTLQSVSEPSVPATPPPGQEGSTVPATTTPNNPGSNNTTTTNPTGRNNPAPPSSGQQTGQGGAAQPPASGQAPPPDKPGDQSTQPTQTTTTP
ncbi:penicillin-binding transpeptidase domain-containing protein [Brevibacillus formosus]|uniref:Penicillin-binding protein n=1 Tax=Brevibacillus formosus TaxID=54913 RepID=A0A837KTW4_9BACL|nr:PASTA domain-containing penicillin-binding protein [Brevibacillus formosus]KLI01015.1 penicillin-binding protein [Brevibacillus formosus]MED1955981.1 penicillin-binding transpeptidase domain-containing protein [Brevibacillus formosus]PSK00306.1 PASTA domain-containing protein [Brevibacillus formosus]GED60360.1 penicillin-binding protein 2B [Brevibacillus formosus]